jgi:hypothetical protein
MLQPDERDAVCGDFAEAGVGGVEALLELLGLVARRQALLWKDWRPWVAMVGLVAPLGMLLCLISRRVADGSALYIWLYANNWDSADLRNAAFRHDFAYYAAVTFFGYVTLFCWSWSSGLVLAAVSRGSLPIHGVLFVLVLFFGRNLGALPHHFGHGLFYSARDFPVNAAAFEPVFYRAILPPMVQVALVLVPSLWGMGQVVRLRKRRML